MLFHRLESVLKALPLWADWVCWLMNPEVYRAGGKSEQVGLEAALVSVRISKFAVALSYGVIRRVFVLCVVVVVVVVGTIPAGFHYLLIGYGLSSGLAVFRGLDALRILG